MITSWISTSLLAGVVLSQAPQHRAHRGQQPLPPPESVLRCVLENEGRIAFTAQQTVVISAERESDATVTHEVHLGGGRYRISYLMPPALANRQAVSDGKWQWEYDPSHKVAVRSPIAQTASGRSAAGTLLGQIRRNYRLELGAGAPVSGRAVYSMSLTPIAAGRRRQTWLIDRKSCLVLKRETYDPDGNLHAVSSFANVDYTAKPRPDIASFKPPAGTRIYTRRSPAVARDLAAARRLAGAWARIPPELGQGFHFESASVISMNGAPAVNLQYSDGLAGVSLVHVRGRASVPPSNGDKHPVMIGTTSGTITHQSRYAVLSWDAAGDTYSLVGDLPDSALVGLARQVP